MPEANDRGTLENENAEVIEKDSQNSPSDEFSDIFDQAAEESTIPAVDAKDASTGTTDDEDKDGKKLESHPTDDKAGEDSAGKDGKKEETPASVAKKGDGDYEQKYKVLQGIHKHDRENWEAEKNKLVSQIEEIKKTVSAKKDEAAGDDAGKKKANAEDEIEFNDEQRLALAEYDKEFDTISRMEGLRRETALKKLETKFLKMVEGWKKDLLDQITPTREFIANESKFREEAGEAAHFSAILEAHEDFEQYRDDGSINKWIESKPAYLRKGLLEIAKNGTAEDVIELLTDFKRETGIIKSDDESEDSSASDGKDEKVVNLQEKKESRRQTLKSPASRKTAVNQRVAQADDYDSAFDEASQK